jgi:hypothetical protein
MSLQVACGHPPGPTPPADYAPSLALSLARSGGVAIVDALARIEAATEIVTYNGNRYDLDKMAKFAQSAGVSFAFKGKHTDMCEICWSSRILGSSLENTFRTQFKTAPPSFPDTYEGNCECDVYMTYRLWVAWKDGSLRILDGQAR